MIKRLYILSFYDCKDFCHVATAWTNPPTRDEIQLAIEEDGHMYIDDEQTINSSLGWVYTHDRRTGYILSRVVEGRVFTNTTPDFSHVLVT